MKHTMLCLMILAAIASPLLLPGAPAALAALDCSGDDWYAEYFNNTGLEGSPALVRCDPEINFDWKHRSPDAAVQADDFSVRWTRSVNVEWAGTYRFYANSDDGMRVWVDDVMLIDMWHERQDAWTWYDAYLSLGVHRIRIEYFEHTGSALARFKFNPQNEGTSFTWWAEYYTNPDLDGDPGITREETDIAFNWGGGSPGEWIPAHWFSARFTRDVIFQGGAFQFLVMTQGGVRLYVDDALILDEWHETGKTTYSAIATLSPAIHSVKLEYMDTWKDAGVTLRWQPYVPPVAGWKGEYFDTEEPGTTPALVRDDPAINFNWGTAAPGVGMPNDHWSARWTRTLNFQAGYYRFTAVTDDGVRLWVDDKQIIDRWERSDASQQFFGDAYLPAGPHAIKMEYFNLTGGGQAHLTWTRTTTTGAQALVDDGDIGFSKKGDASGWKTLYYGYGNRALQTPNQAGYWAQWAPVLPRLGRYEVWAYIPWGYSMTQGAVYRIKHEGDVAVVTVNQRANAGRWVSLGAYGFNADGTEWVYLDSQTLDASGTTTVGYDAIKFVLKGE